MEEKMAKANKNIPKDIIDEKILPCLPVKSLMRFKCVCKSWSSFITSPQFTRCYLERALSENPKTIAPKLLVLLPCGFKCLDLENSFDEGAALIRQLFGVGETLYCITNVTNNSSDVLEFWHCIQGSWTKVFSFPASNGFRYFLNHFLSISKGNQLITENDEDVLRFDAEGGIVERIRMCNSPTPSLCVGYRRIDPHPCDTITYIETLVSPKAVMHKAEVLLENAADQGDIP